MLELGIGIVIGILLSFILFSFGASNEAIIKRALRRLGESIRIPEKAEFIIPFDEETGAVADVIKKNDEEGKDTNLNEL